MYNTNDSLAGSLRQAIQDASPGDTIVFQIPTSSPGYNANTGIFTIGLTSGELVVNKNLVIDGGGHKITVQRSNSAATKFRVFNITAGTVLFSRLTIANGNIQGTGGVGGGILNAGVLTLESCTLSGSFSSNTQGGGIFSSNSLTVRKCTFANNNAGTVGGNEKGGAIYNSGTLSVMDSTFVGNRASRGSGISNFGTARVRNTILVGNIIVSSPSDLEGAFISDGYNLIGDATFATGFPVTGDQVGATTAQANLSPLRDHGGPTLTMRPQPGSLAIDQGKRGLDGNGQPINLDQRGSPRPIDSPGVGSAVGGDGSDIGAVEVGLVQAGPTFTVTNTSAHNDGNCTADDCTLVEALYEANLSADPNTIEFAPQVSGTINLYAGISTGGLWISHPLTIHGPGARVLTIFGDGGRDFFA